MARKLDKATDKKIGDIFTYYYDEIGYMLHLGLNRSKMSNAVGISIEVIRTGKLKVIKSINVTLKL
jgi:hypothetical protein